MITGETLRLTHTGIDEVQKLQDKRKRSFWTQISPTMPVKEGYFDSKQIAKFKELLIVPKGQAPIEDTAEELRENRFYPILWGRTYSWDLEASEDDVYNEIAAIPSDAAIAQNYTWNVQGVSVFANGHDSTYLIRDGEAFFSTAHPSATGVADRSNKASPTLALSSTNLEIELMELWNTLDPLGRIMGFDGNARLIVNNKLFPVATRIATADKFAQTNDNDPNFTKSYINVSRQPYLPQSSNNWYLQNGSQEDHGVRMLTWFRNKVIKLPMNGSLTEGIVILSRFLPAVLSWEGTRSSGN